MAETRQKIKNQDILNARQSREDAIDEAAQEALTVEKPPVEPAEQTSLEKKLQLEKEIDELEASEKIRELEEKKAFLLNKGRPEAKNSGEPAEKPAEKPRNPILEEW